VTRSVPWQERLSGGTEAVQDEVIGWYRRTPEGQAYVPTMIWGTLQTEAYATVILGQVVDFLGVPDDLPSLTLGIIPATAPVDMLPVHAFNLHGDEVHVELVSSGLNVTEPAELGLYREAFS